MINSCEKCGSKHIIHIDNMEICDDCLSTIVYDDGGSVLSNHITTDAFVKYYNSVRTSIGSDSSLSEEVCKNLVSMELDIPTVLNMYGICLVNKGDYDNSIKYFRKAIEINPAYGAAYCNIAKAYYAKEDYDGMLQNLKWAEKYILPEDDRYKDFMGAYAYALAAKGMVNNAENKLKIAEKYGFANGDNVRSLLSPSKVSINKDNADPYESMGVASTETKTENNGVNSENIDKKAGLNKDQISIELPKEKIPGDWKKWIWIALGVLVLLFIFSAKFRNMVMDFIVGAIIIGVIVLLVVWFIKDPVGFLEAVASSSGSVSSGGGGTSGGSFGRSGSIKIRQGKWSSGEILYTFDGKNIRQGKWNSGEILYTFDGKYIRQGKWSSGDILYNIDRT